MENDFFLKNFDSGICMRSTPVFFEGLNIPVYV